MPNKVNFYKGKPIRYKIKNGVKYSALKDIGAIIGNPDASKLIHGLNPDYFFKDKILSIDGQKLQEMWMGNGIGVLAILEKRTPAGSFKGLRTWMTKVGILPGKAEETTTVVSTDTEVVAVLPVAVDPILQTATPDISGELAEIREICGQILELVKSIALYTNTAASTFSFKKELTSFTSSDDMDGIG